MSGFGIVHPYRFKGSFTYMQETSPMWSTSGRFSGVITSTSSKNRNQKKYKLLMTC
ncbi:hypothetical protein BVRB_1g010510 [Beta vulgaris subsp. vulgaris]|nr:hypothetical protein BVRB_1g010510 [Beta vulgaris subsp. vulgaris]